MTDVAGSGAPGTPDASGAPGAGNTPPPTAPAYAVGVTDPETVAWLTNKNFPDLNTALRSHHSLERVFGAERAGNTVVLPGEKATPADKEAFYNRLGRPATADKYEFDLPENADKNFVDWARKAFHEEGLTAGAAKGVVAKYNAFAAEAQKQAGDAAAAEVTRSQEALVKDWGAAYEHNLAQAKNGARASGFTADEIDAMQKVVGFDGIMKKFQTLGSRLGEGTFVAPGGQSQGFAPKTPAAASAEIDSLKGDRDFQARVISGDKSANERWARLHQEAFSGKR